MPVFEYQALDSSGRKQKGVVDAADARTARQLVKGRGLFPQSLKETTRSPAASKTSAKAPKPDAPVSAGSGLSGGLESLKNFDLSRINFKINLTRVSTAQLAATTRQLATLLSAGLPLEQALSGTLEQVRGTGLFAVLAQVRERVKEGSSLAQALGEHHRVFGQTYITMVDAGEQSGTLELVMQRLADFAEQELALKRKVVSAVAYPVLMAVFGIGVVFFLMGFVVPRMTEIFVDMDQALPTPTVVLMAVSDAVRGYWFVAPLLVVAAMAGLTYVGRTEAGRRRIDAVKLKLPVVGRLRQALAMARFARTLGTLHANGAPLLTSLDIVANVVDNTVMAQAIREVRAQVSEGATMAAALAEQPVFPAVLVQMVSAGEQSGNLDDLLLRASDMYEEEIETRLAVMTSLLEPAMIILLGGMVGFVVLAVLLPIFEMSNLVK